MSDDQDQKIPTENEIIFLCFLGSCAHQCAHRLTPPPGVLCVFVMSSELHAVCVCAVQQPLYALYEQQ